jgi:uncharacterized phage protein (TIGR01671 family)
MREIKFRVWSNELKKYRFLSDVNDNQGLGMYFEVVNGWGGNTTTIYHSVGDVPEQYTGLKDQNSKEIYEGDIIKYFGANKRVKVKTTYGIVFYDSEHGCFNSRIQNGEHGKGGISLANDLVIGNIHENADLLEGKNEN